MKIELEPSGERVIEDAYQQSLGGYVIYLMHVATYRFARDHCKGLRVLDLGCGSGYGAASLADAAAAVMAVDVSTEAVAFARERYRAENLSFQVIDGSGPLPFPDGQFDVVLSFQVIEHVDDEAAYLREARRVLVPGGVMIIVTPDRTLRLLPFQKPWNRWHLREYSMDSLERIVRPWLHVEKMQYMGAVDEVAHVEIRRYRLAKWALLPFTLAFVPEPLRRWGLDLVHALRGKRTRVDAGDAKAPRVFDFDQSVMQIGEVVPNPLNLVLLARRRDPDDAERR